MQLNTDRIEDAMARKGLSQADLAASLEVSRESVSKWIRGNAMPRPGRVLRLCRLLDLGFDDIYRSEDLRSVPVVAFRKNGASKTTEEHVTRATDMGYQLKPLVKHLPFDTLSHPASFVDPMPSFDYVGRAADEVRRRMNLTSEVVSFTDIIRFFSEVHAVLIPVMWGKQKQHENALHIYLPDSMTSWVFMNLEVRLMDFKFWMAHELAHAKTPTLDVHDAEVFADLFAAELLFPVEISARYHAIAIGMRNSGAVVNTIRDIAQDFVVPPVTVLDQMNRYAQRSGKPTIDVNIHPATTNFNKKFSDVNEIVFGGEHPSASTYVRVCEKEFGTPFFAVLADHLRETGQGASFVQRVMNIGPVDAKSIHSALLPNEPKNNP